MAINDVGYEFLRTSLSLSAFEPDVVARIERVTRVSSIGSSVVAVPPGVAPSSGQPIEHLLFALKHERLNLQIAQLALKKISAEDVIREFHARPTSQYARLVCYLWEVSHRATLESLQEAGGPYVPLFDPAAFLTGKTVRSARWRVDFNGIGSPRYCITVRRTPEIQRLLNANILDEAKAFIDEIDPAMIDRAVSWAYLSETDSSYEIERESPTLDKREAFAKLLSQAKQPLDLTEQYLVELQNLTITNPHDKAFEFRGKQNWLRSSQRGPRGVSYVPPPPDLAAEIMEEIMSLANDRASRLDSLVLGSLLSFGFVFTHPFMDGNGRLSRFLFHKAVCRDERLSSGLVLPISIAMKRHEDLYLKALESFSKKSREFWSVTAIDHEVTATFDGEPELYRYWDGTDCVEFGLKMAQEALAVDLRDETEFLRRFDLVYQAANEAVDMNNNDLVQLVRGFLKNDGVTSNNMRKKMIAKGHPERILQAADRAMASRLAEDNLPADSDSAPRPTVSLR